MKKIIRCIKIPKFSCIFYSCEVRPHLSAAEARDIPVIKM